MLQVIQCQSLYWLINKRLLLNEKKYNFLCLRIMYNNIYYTLNTTCRHEICRVIKKISVSDLLLCKGGTNNGKHKLYLKKL